MTLVAYVSGHGFGHATRTAEVLRAVREAAPKQPLAVVTTAPESLFHEAGLGPFEYRRVACDVGLVQRGALVIDEEGTIRRLRAFEVDRPRLVEAEAAWLRTAGARLVLADIPPLAFEAASAAGVPSVGLANFSWDWIYGHLARRRAEFEEPARRAAAAYAQAGLLLQLPFAGDLTAFPRREAVPMVARRQRRPRAEARRLLEFDDAPTVLVSFGGLGLPGFDPGVLAELAPYRFVLETDDHALPGNVRGVTRAGLKARGLEYLDVIGAADVALTKPGYGIVTDCIAAGTRLVYTDRGDFPEYPILVAEMARHLPCAYVSNDDVRAGFLEEALAAVLQAPFPPPPRLDGADVAARRLLGPTGV
jgi:L-arabinokinase